MSRSVSASGGAGKGICCNCMRLLFREYGDGERLCAVCRENRENNSSGLLRAIEPRPGEPWQPVKGTIGGKRYGS